MGDQVRVRVANALSGQEMLATTSLPRKNIVRYLLRRLGSRASRPAQIFHAGASVGEDWQVQPSQEILLLTATIGNALPAEERAELLREFSNLDHDHYSVFPLKSPAVRDDEALALAAIGRDVGGYLLRFASKALRNNRELVLAAVRQCGTALQYASRDLRGDAAIVRAAVEQRASALEHASAELRADPAMATFALQKGLPFWVLLEMCPAARHDRGLALAAIELGAFPGLLGLACEALRTDFDGFNREAHKRTLATVEQCGAVLAQASQDLRADAALLPLCLATAQEGDDHSGPGDCRQRARDGALRRHDGQPPNRRARLREWVPGTAVALARGL